jgi:hypothetical protein
MMAGYPDAVYLAVPFDPGCASHAYDKQARGKDLKKQVRTKLSNLRNDACKKFQSAVHFQINFTRGGTGERNRLLFGAGDGKPYVRVPGALALIM